jgi:nitrite reductase/ring-hydroxylating ferredoxin subunit
VLVYRDGDRFSVLLGECAHRGGPLAEGRTVESDGTPCVECPWHGSVFALTDGRAVRGPASSDQTLLRSRIHDGHLEVARP